MSIVKLETYSVVSEEETTAYIMNIVNKINELIDAYNQYENKINNWEFEHQKWKKEWDAYKSPLPICGDYLIDNADVEAQRVKGL